MESPPLEESKNRVAVVPRDVQVKLKFHDLYPRQTFHLALRANDSHPTQQQTEPIAVQGVLGRAVPPGVQHKRISCRPPAGRRHSRTAGSSPSSSCSSPGSRASRHSGQQRDSRAHSRRTSPQRAAGAYQFSIISLMAFAGLWMTSPAAMRFTTASSSRRMTPATRAMAGARPARQRRASGRRAGERRAALSRQTTALPRTTHTALRSSAIGRNECPSIGRLPACGERRGREAVARRSRAAIGGEALRRRGF